MSDTVISVLNRLIEVCRNGQYGFREAAEVAADRHLTAIFLDLSEQREQFAAQLRYQVSLSGGRPHDHGTLSGILHRRWMEIRRAVTSRSDSVVIAECERGEDFALRAYDEAARFELPAAVAGVVDDQRTQILAAREMLRGLEVKLRHEPCY